MVALFKSPVERLETDVNRLRVQVAEAEASRAAAEARKATLRSEATRAAAEGVEGPDVSAVLREIRADLEAASLRQEAAQEALGMKEAALLEAKKAEKTADLLRSYEDLHKRVPAARRALESAAGDFFRELATYRGIYDEEHRLSDAAHAHGIPTRHQVPDSAFDRRGLTHVSDILLETGRKVFQGASIAEYMQLPAWNLPAKDAR